MKESDILKMVYNSTISEKELYKMADKKTIDSLIEDGLIALVRTRNSRKVIAILTLKGFLRIK